MKSLKSSSQEDWMERAACNEENHHLFFGQRTKAAREICATCPVQAPCLDLAIRENYTFGVWGGTSPYQRQQMRKAAKNDT